MSEPRPPAPRRFLTEEVSGIDFRYKVEPEDFVVDELPLATPGGEGTHVWFRIEKRGITTADAVRRIAQQLDVAARDVGYAGLKDAWAVTTQWLSVEHVEPERVAALDLDGITVVEVARHTRKLKVGTLLGNRFRLLLRDVPEDRRADADRALGLIAARGMLNGFGSQRFGNTGRGHELGRHLVLRRWREYVLGLFDPEAWAPRWREPLERCVELLGAGATAEVKPLAKRLPRALQGTARQLVRNGGDWFDGARAVPQKTRQLAVSALQSAVFNDVLARRVGDVHRLEQGDVAWIHAKRAAFVVGEEDLVGAEERLAAFELSPSGPLPGHAMLEARGRVGALEQEVLSDHGLALADFRGMGLGIDQKGARRPLRIPVRALESAWEPAGLRLSFELGKGSFATTLLEELAKGPLPRPGASDDRGLRPIASR